MFVIVSYLWFRFSLYINHAETEKSNIIWMLNICLLLHAAWRRDLTNQGTYFHRSGYLFLAWFNVSFTFFRCIRLAFQCICSAFSVYLFCFFSAIMLLFRSNSRKYSRTGSGGGSGESFCLFLAKVISKGLSNPRNRSKANIEE